MLGSFVAIFHFVKVVPKKLEPSAAPTAEQAQPPVFTFSVVRVGDKCERELLSKTVRSDGWPDVNSSALPRLSTETRSTMLVVSAGVRTLDGNLALFTTRPKFEGVSFRPRVPLMSNLGYVCVVQLNASYVLMYYRCGNLCPKMDVCDRWAACVVFSVDGGRSFHYPNASLFHDRRHLPSNEFNVVAGFGAEFHTFSAFRDPLDAEFPVKAFAGSKYLVLLRSKDGFRFERLCPNVLRMPYADIIEKNLKPTIPSLIRSYIDSSISAFYDPTHGVFQAYFRFNRHHQTRCVQRVESRAAVPESGVWSARQFVEFPTRGNECGLWDDIYTTALGIHPIDAGITLAVPMRIRKHQPTRGVNRQYIGHVDAPLFFSTDGGRKWANAPPLERRWPESSSIAADLDTFLTGTSRFRPLKEQKVMPAGETGAWLRTYFPTFPDFAKADTVHGWVNEAWTYPAQGFAHTSGHLTFYLQDLPLLSRSFVTRWTVPAARLFGAKGEGTISFPLRACRRCSLCVNYAPREDGAYLLAQVRDASGRISTGFSFRESHPTTTDADWQELHWKQNTQRNHPPDFDLEVRLAGNGSLFAVSKCQGHQCCTHVAL